MCKYTSNSVSSIVVNHVGLIGEYDIYLIVLIFLIILIINILGLIPIHQLHIFLNLAIITAYTIIDLIHYDVQFFTFHTWRFTSHANTTFVLIETISLGIQLRDNIIAEHSLLMIVSSFVFNSSSTSIWIYASYHFLHSW
jgi:hypothetical protein